MKIAFKTVLINFLVLSSMLACGQSKDKTLIINRVVSQIALDTMAKKHEGHLSGWIGYTSSRTEDAFAPSNNFNWFPASLDRIHDFSLVLTYQFNDRWIISGNLIASNGNLVHTPLGSTFSE